MGLIRLKKYVTMLQTTNGEGKPGFFGSMKIIVKIIGISMLMFFSTLLSKFANI